MIVFSVVRLRKAWVPWVTRFVFVIALIYLLSAAFQWFSSTSSSNLHPPTMPVRFATGLYDKGSGIHGAKYEPTGQHVFLS